MWITGGIIGAFGLGIFVLQRVIARAPERNDDGTPLGSPYHRPEHETKYGPVEDSERIPVHH